MLKRIHVKGLKSLKDVEVELAPLTVILGPNSSGKSNFLEALLLLSRLVTERTLAEAFEAPLRGYPLEAFSLPKDGLAGLLAQDKATLSIEADVVVGDDAKKPQTGALRYRVAVAIEPASGALRVEDEYLVRLKKGGGPKHLPRVERDAEHLSVRRLGEGSRPRFEPLGLNHTLASNLQYSGSALYPDFDRLRSELASWRTHYLDPRVAMRTAQPPRDVSDIGPRGEWIAPFLYRLKGDPNFRRHFEAVRRVLRSVVPSIDGLEVDLDRQRGTLDVSVVQDGTPYSSRVISEGTLRVLGLAALAANPQPSAVFAFEEPENGVHPRRIEVIAELLMNLATRRRSQIIITTHSPILVGVLARRWYERRTSHQGLVSLLRSVQTEGATRLVPFEPEFPLFRDSEIHEALIGGDDPQVRLIEEMYLRGWLDA